MRGHLEIYILYNIWNALLLGWGRYTLFKTKLRLPLKWVLVLVGVLSTACYGLWYFFLQPFISFPVARFLIIAVLFAASCLIIKAPFPKHALSYLTIFTVNTILDALALYVYVLIPGLTVPYIDIALLVLMQPLALLPLIRIMRKVTELLSAAPNNRVWWYLCLNGFSTVLMCLTTSASYQPNEELLVSRAYLFFAMFGMLAATVWVQKSMHAAAQTEVQLQVSQNQVQMQQGYYDNLIGQMEEIRHIRHDLRHHRAALAAMIKNGDTQAAEEYIQNWNVLDASMPVTGNLVADSLLHYFSTRAKELEFTLQTEVSLPKLPGISEHDLCVLMGNLLENALDAQAYLAPEQRFVSVRAKSDENSFTLAVDNRFDGTVLQEDGRYVTRKEEVGHGIGLSSVKTVCKKYDGVLQLETKEDLFLAGIVIGL